MLKRIGSRRKGWGKCSHPIYSGIPLECHASYIQSWEKGHFGEGIVVEFPFVLRSDKADQFEHVLFSTKWWKFIQVVFVKNGRGAWCYNSRPLERCVWMNWFLCPLLHHWIHQWHPLTNIHFMSLSSSVIPALACTLPIAVCHNNVSNIFTCQFFCNPVHVSFTSLNILSPWPAPPTCYAMGQTLEALTVGWSGKWNYKMRSKLGYLLHHALHCQTPPMYSGIFWCVDPHLAHGTLWQIFTLVKTPLPSMWQLLHGH